MALTRSRYNLLWLALAAMLAASPASADEAVVTGAKSDVSALTRNEVRDLFLGNISSLPDGVTAVLVDRPESSPMRNEFYLKVTNKTATQVSALWAKLYFTGRGVPPHEARDTAEVKKFVNTTPGSVGYIDVSAVDPSVRVLLIVN